MTFALWIIVGLLAGAAASITSRDGKNRFALDIAIGLVASIVGGVLSILIQ